MRQRKLDAPVPDWDALAHEPRLLSDARLLGALHAELRARLGPDEGLRSLFQLGLLHGLRDARRAGACQGDRLRPGDRCIALAPVLPIALGARPRGTPRGDVALVGSWPSAHEAEAHRARLGPSDTPVCGFSSGYTAGWYSGLLERDLATVERSCVARGDDACRFEVRDLHALASDGDARALLHELPFAELRALAERPSPGQPPAPRAEPQAAAIASPSGDIPIVHVWGSVMVIPYPGPEAALRALELIHTDPAAHRVSVVVLDLAEATLDAAFGAAELEGVVAAIESAGAEALLAAVQPLSESAVSELADDGLLVYKDVPLAIAAAFQIAEAQERTV